MQGGVDYRLHLSIKKVSTGSPAHNKLHAGDVIVGIQGNDCTHFTHQQANDLIRMSGSTLSLMVRKLVRAYKCNLYRLLDLIIYFIFNRGQYSIIKPTKPAVKFTQVGQSTVLPAQNAYRRF